MSASAVVIVEHQLGLAAIDSETPAVNGCDAHDWERPRRSEQCAHVAIWPSGAAPAASYPTDSGGEWASEGN
jgi:hypothetical protein